MSLCERVCVCGSSRVCDRTYVYEHVSVCVREGICV